MATAAETIDFTDYSLQAKLIIWTDKTSGCHEWQGTKQTGGYGTFKFRGRVYLAHRVAWAFANQADPGSYSVDHKCHNTSCVTPDHLRLATSKQNAEHVLPVRAKSGFRGVHEHGTGWRATVRHHGRAHHSKVFRTMEEANAAAVTMRNSLYTHNLLDRQSA